MRLLQPIIIIQLIRGELLSYYCTQPCFLPVSVTIPFMLNHGDLLIELVRSRYCSRALVT